MDLKGVWFSVMRVQGLAAMLDVLRNLFYKNKEQETGQLV